MKIGVQKILVPFLFLSIISCNQNSQRVSSDTNILLQEWTGDFGGLPAFDQMKLEDLKPALEEAMRLNLEEVDVIANNNDAPTFENTIVALERTGSVYDRVGSYYGIWRSNLSSSEFRGVQSEMAPKISAFRSKIIQNEKLFSRIKTVYEASLNNPLPKDQQRVVQLTYERFAINGADLDLDSKKRYAEINEALSTLHTNFGNNVLADEENYVVFFSQGQIGGLPESYIKSATDAAVERGKPGQYAVTNTRSSMDPFLTYSTERDLRKKVWENYYSRGNNDDSLDNKKNIVEILKLRDERVGLLGFDNYAQWRLQNRMAKAPENAMKMMKSVWPAAIARVKEEVTDMQEIANADNIKIEAWDYRYYAEKVRKKKYDLDSDKVKQYLQLDKLREAMFFVAGELFNFSFEPVPDSKVPVYHKDVKVWEVKNKTSGEHIGLWYLDPYSRKGKRSGAWATTYRAHTTFDGNITVLCSNNSNFVKPSEGEALLISWTDAETFFHEFGHALHYLASDIKYPALNNGVRDYTEFQSQLLESWLSTDKVINNYLVHFETGKPMPKELIAKVKNAATFNQGFSTTEYLASALMDLYYHTTDPESIEVSAFEKETLASLEMPKEIVMRHRSTHFGHIFSSEGYAAGYYGYMWADVLTSDAVEAFKESPGGFYDKEMAAKLVKYLFAPRNSMDPADAYRLFRGRDAKIDALMRTRGFPVSK